MTPTESYRPSISVSSDYNFLWIRNEQGDMSFSCTHCDKRDDFFWFLLQKKRCCPNKQAGTIGTKEIAAEFSMTELTMNAGRVLKGAYMVDSCFLLSLLSPVLIPPLNGTVWSTIFLLICNNFNKSEPWISAPLLWSGSSLRPWRRDS